MADAVTVSHGHDISSLLSFQGSKKVLTDLQEKAPLLIEVTADRSRPFRSPFGHISYRSILRFVRRIPMREEHGYNTIVTITRGKLRTKLLYRWRDIWGLVGHTLEDMGVFL